MIALVALLGCVAGPTPAPTPELLALPSGPEAMTPVLLQDGDGVLLLWQEPGSVRLSRWTELGWSSPQLVVADDALMQNQADHPTLARGPAGELVVSWLRSTPGEDPYAYEVRLSVDRGQGFEELGRLHGDEVAAEHGFVSLLPTDEGVRAWWLDGREVPSGGATGLRTALIDSSGVRDELLVDGRVCDCCGTAAMRADEGPVVLYRDRSPDEYRDVAWAGSSYGRLADAWNIAGCPVNGPAADGSVAAWFTAADEQPRIRASIGLGQPFTVAPSEREPLPLGRTEVVDLGQEALVLYLDEHGALKGRRVSEGGVGPPRVVGAMEPSRASGFPTAVRVGDEVLTVWTGRGLEASRTPLEHFGPVEARSGADPAETLRSLSLQTLDGQPLSLEGPVVVALWATWCPPCREELPLLQALHEQGVPVVAVSVDAEGQRDAVVAMAEGLTLPVAHAPEAASALGLTAVPATYVLDGEGALAWSSVGVLDAEDPALMALRR